jgi:hypothetical protein
MGGIICINTTFATAVMLRKLGLCSLLLFLFGRHSSLTSFFLFGAAESQKLEKGLAATQAENDMISVFYRDDPNHKKTSSPKCRLVVALGTF